MDYLRRRRRIIATAAAVAAGGAACYAAYTFYRRGVAALTRDEGEDDPATTTTTAGPSSSSSSSHDDLEKAFRGVLEVVATRGFATHRDRLVALLREGNTDGLTAALAALPKGGAKEKKLALWQDLKVVSFAHAVGVVWGVALLNALVSAQLCVAARIGKDLADGDVAPDALRQARTALEQRMRKQVDAFISGGTLAAIASKAKAASESALRDVDLRRPMRFSEPVGMLACISVTAEFEIGKPGGGWRAVLLPTDAAGNDESDADALAGDAVADLERSLGAALDRPEFAMAVSASARCVSDAVLARCERTFASQAAKGAKGAKDAPLPAEASLPLAKVVPLVATAADAITNECEPIVRTQVAPLPEVVRACADAFSVHRTL